MWDGVIPLLAEHGRPVAPTLVAAQTGPCLQADIAARLAAQTRDTSPPWHVVGHSFGGQVALELVLRRPDLVARLTLLCTRDTPYPPFAAAADDVAAGRVGADGALRRWFSPDELADGGPAVRYARTALRTADLPSWAAALRAISTFDCSAAARSISCPALVVAAENDEVSDPAAMTAMHLRLNGSQFVVLADAWHMSVFTDPLRLAGLLNR